MFVLGVGEGKSQKGRTRRAREAGTRGGKPSALYTRLDIFMAISPPRLYSDCRAAAVYRHSLDTGGNRSDIWIGGKRSVAPFPTGMKNNVAESVFRRPLKATAHAIPALFIRDNFRPAKTT